MRIETYTDNPVIANQTQFYELEELLHEIEPNCEMVQLRTDRLIIVNIRRKTFHYPRNPSIEWVAARLQSMVDNGL